MQKARLRMQFLCMGWTWAYFWPDSKMALAQGFICFITLLIPKYLRAMYYANVLQVHVERIRVWILRPMTDRLGLNKLTVIADVENATDMEEHAVSKLKHFLQVIPLEQLQLLIPISLSTLGI